MVINKENSNKPSIGTNIHHFQTYISKNLIKSIHAANLTHGMCIKVTKQDLLVSHFLFAVEKKTLQECL